MEDFELRARLRYAEDMAGARLLIPTVLMNFIASLFLAAFAISFRSIVGYILFCESLVSLFALMYAVNYFSDRAERRLMWLKIKLPIKEI